MAVPVVVRNGTLFFWNLSANVGRTSPNRPDDVQLVQLGYACAAKDPAVDAKMRPIFAAVVPGAPYTGLPNDPLTIAIIADQKDRRGNTQDGHISVLTNFARGHLRAGSPIHHRGSQLQHSRRVAGNLSSYRQAPALPTTAQGGFNCCCWSHLVRVNTH